MESLFALPSPQVLGKSCWLLVAFALLHGLIRKQTFWRDIPQRRADKTLTEDESWKSPAKWSLVSQTSKLAVTHKFLSVPFDYWTFSMISSLSAMGIIFALDERVSVYSDWFYEASRSAAAIPDISSLVTVSSAFLINLWLGILLKSMVITSQLYSRLVIRTATPDNGLAKLDFFEAAALILFLWVYEQDLLPAEARIRKETHVPHVVRQLETVFSFLRLSTILAFVLAIIPWVRYYKVILYSDNIQSLEGTKTPVNVIAIEERHGLPVETLPRIEGSRVIKPMDDSPPEVLNTMEAVDNVKETICDETAHLNINETFREKITNTAKVKPDLQKSEVIDPVTEADSITIRQGSLADPDRFENESHHETKPLETALETEVVESDQEKESTNIRENSYFDTDSFEMEFILTTKPSETRDEIKVIETVQETDSTVGREDSCANPDQLETELLQTAKPLKTAHKTEQPPGSLIPKEEDTLYKFDFKHSDLLIGGGLCASGIILAYSVLRKLK